MRTAGRGQKTLLVVDDDASLRGAIADILRETGYDVLEAASGTEGLHLAERHAPDAILLDLAMPGRSGLEVLKELNQREPTRDIPVVIASAYALALLGDHPRGADGVIQKPFDLAELLARVQRVASGKPAAAPDEGRFPAAQAAALRRR